MSYVREPFCRKATRELYKLGTSSAGNQPDAQDVCSARMSARLESMIGTVYQPDDL